jgi:hypothetical protein
MVQVLLGQLGSQEDAELTPQTLVVEVGGGGGVTPGGAILRGTQLHPLKSLDNRVDVGGASGVNQNTNLLPSPSYGDDEV